jgi:hypothetical protein
MVSQLHASVRAGHNTLNPVATHFPLQQSNILHVALFLFMHLYPYVKCSPLFEWHSQEPRETQNYFFLVKAALRAIFVQVARSVTTTISER